MERYEHLYIGGDWVSSSGTEVIDVVSPTDGHALGRVPHATTADLDRAVAEARAAVDSPGGWSSMSPGARGELLLRFADELEKSATQTASAITQQNGMPINTALAFEANFPAVLLRYYVGVAVAREAEERRTSMLGGTTVVRRDPVGVVAAIVPWNFPQTLSFLKIAPALAAGCAVVLKPAPETVLDSFVMAQAAAAAGLPSGVINVVPGGRDLGASLVAHPGVDKVAFTGSTVAGRAIAETCGRLLRPVTLELGGKSAAIVLDDADLASTMESFVAATMLNNGQTCFLSTRILVAEAKYESTLDLITSAISGLTVGDPMDEKTQIGPLVSSRQRQRVEDYIAMGRADGVRVTTGGGRPLGFDDGFFVEPTVFADVDNDHVLAQEEIFGPVLSVIRYQDVDHAVHLANSSGYGLGGTVWSSNPERAMAVARRIDTGTIGINSYVNDPGSPFGGVKASGLGRELGPEALDSYETVKSIYNAP